MKELRIVFMGTPDFAVGILRELVQKDYPIAGVVTAPDKPSGRGQKVTPSAVKEFALTHRLPLLQPHSLKDESFLNNLKAWNANLQIVVAFRMLPRVVWDMPNYGTFNLHASLLPQYRGAAPIQWAIINGATETGVTTFFIDEQIDTGAIIASKRIAITDKETEGSLHDKLMTLGSALVLETVDAIAKGTVKTMPQPQDQNLKSAPKLTAENTRIDWNRPSLEIDRLIRGLAPYPTAWTELHNGSKVLKTKIYEGHIIHKPSLDVPGTIIPSNKELLVATQDGYLQLELLQLPGKKKMSVRDLMNGFALEKEAQFV